MNTGKLPQIISPYKNKEDKNNNNVAYIAFILFGIAFILHTMVINTGGFNWRAYLAFALYLIASVIAIIAWIRHFKGKRLSYFSMIVAGLSALPFFIFTILLIKILLM